MRFAIAVRELSLIAVDYMFVRVQDRKLLRHSSNTLSDSSILDSESWTRACSESDRIEIADSGGGI